MHCCSTALATPTPREPSPNSPTQPALQEQLILTRPPDATSSSPPPDAAPHAAVSPSASSHPNADRIVPAPNPSTPTGHLHLTMIVIGKVEAATARILVEVLESGSIEVQLKCVQRHVRQKQTKMDGSSNTENPTVSKSTASDGAHILTCTQVVEGGRPRIFKFAQLESDARYEVSIVNLAHAQPASQFRTLLDNWRITPDVPAMRFATVSCNLLSETLTLKNSQVDLWADLALRIQRDEIDYLLHIGDQVYADENRSDNETAAPVSIYAPAEHAVQGEGLDMLAKEDQLVFRKALTLLEKVEDRQQWPQYKEQIEEFYRQLYRETWSHKPTAVVLANVPNLTIYDDHDFVDNWGQLPHHRDKDRTSKDFFIATCARQVYWEYQGSLHRDVDLTRVESITRDHHFHTFGEYGIVMTESRGAGSFRYDPKDPTPFLGRIQWQDLDEAFQEGGMLQQVKHLLLVCPCPVVYLPHGLNGVLETIVQDALGHWASEPFRAEQTRMLNMALMWQEGRGFGERLREIDAPSKPKLEPIVRDEDEEANVHRTVFPSLVGEKPQEAVEKEDAADGERKIPESAQRVDERKSADRTNHPITAASSALEISPCRSDRRVTFLAGDVHVGGHTRIFKHGHLVLEQLVSSAISNHVLPAVAFKIGELMQNSYTQLDDGWSFEHQGFTRFRNYGLIDTIRPSAGVTSKYMQKPMVCTSIISAE